MLLDCHDRKLQAIDYCPFNHYDLLMATSADEKRIRWWHKHSIQLKRSKRALVHTELFELKVNVKCSQSVKEKVEAIDKIRNPENIGLRIFQGLIHYCAGSLLHLLIILTPLNQLLKKSSSTIFNANIILYMIQWLNKNWIIYQLMKRCNEDEEEHKTYDTCVKRLHVPLWEPLT